MNDKLGIQDAMTRFDELQARKRQINAELQAEREKAERLAAMQDELTRIDRELPHLGKETLDAFSARQQCTRKRIYVQGVGWLFENGATHPGGLDYGNEAPADPIQRAKGQRLYVAHLLEREEQAWQSFRSQCISQAAMARMYSNCPPPPEDAPERLAKGKERIDALRAELAQYEQIIQSGTDTRAAQANQALDRERREAIEKTYNALHALQI